MSVALPGGMESLSQMGMTLFNAFNKNETPTTPTKEPHLTPLERLQQRSSPRRQVRSTVDCHGTTNCNCDTDTDTNKGIFGHQMKNNVSVLIKERAHTTIQYTCTYNV